jgi:ribokinase
MFVPDIVGLGQDNVDVVIRLERLPRWEDMGKFSGFTLAHGGPAGTACVVTARFGVPTGFIDKLGNDEMTAFRLSGLKQAGVDVSRMVKRDSPENRIVLVYVQEKTGECFFCSHKNMRSQPIQPEELDHDYITSAKYLHLDGSHPRASLQAARWMHKAGKMVVLDAKKTNNPVPDWMQAIVAESDVLICGSGFCSMLTGEKNLQQARRLTLDKGPDIVVQTEGINGSYTVGKNEEFHTPAFKVDVIDTTGAGDVFHGAYLYGLLQDWDLKRITIFSSAVSAITCTVLGNRNGLPSLREAEEFIRARHCSSTSVCVGGL